MMQASHACPETYTTCTLIGNDEALLARLALERTLYKDIAARAAGLPLGCELGRQHVPAPQAPMSLISSGVETQR